jgi:hypothetical protein
MNLPPHLISELARYHQRDMRAAAERQRLARLARDAVPYPGAAKRPRRLRKVLSVMIRPFRRRRRALASGLPQ